MLFSAIVTVPTAIPAVNSLISVYEFSASVNSGFSFVIAVTFINVGVSFSTVFTIVTSLMLVFESRVSYDFISFVRPMSIFLANTHVHILRGNTYVGILLSKVYVGIVFDYVCVGDVMIAITFLALSCVKAVSRREDASCETV
jgi:hypothetical protein